MQWSRRKLGLLATLVALSVTLFADSALARRTLIDANVSSMNVGGYCSPLAAGTADCSAQDISFSIQIGSETYSSFYVNSNGTVSFTSIETQLALQNSFEDFPSPENYTGPQPADSLADYPAPIFSPFFLDGPGDPTTFAIAEGFDGELVAQTSVSDSNFTIDWYACQGPLACGLASLDLIQNAEFGDGLTDLIIHFSPINCCTAEEVFEAGKQPLIDVLSGSLPVYTMTLTDLPDGFQVDYSYNAPALGDIGLYGFNLPSGLFEVNGPLANRTYYFDSSGQLITPVPEPATWLMMLLGFGASGLAVRRQRSAFVAPA